MLQCITWVLGADLVFAEFESSVRVTSASREPGARRARMVCAGAGVGGGAEERAVAAL